MVVVDFETQAIVDGSGQAPEPVGVAIYELGKEARYYAWGHPTANNCTYEEGRRALAAVWDQPLLFHNGKFDIGVAMQHMGLPWPREWHDTMYLLYLDNPIADSLSLKPSAARILGLPPDEQDAVGAWLISHGVVPWNSKNWGAHIAKAPGDLVGRYAIGDVLRTYGLYEFLHEAVFARDMQAAYEREINITPVLSAAEREGVRIDRERLLVDTEAYQSHFETADRYIRALLRDESLDIDSPAALANALDAAGLAGEWLYTPTGKRSTSRESLAHAIRDKTLLNLLSYRGALKTLLSTFMKGWLVLSERDGRLHPSWNNVRGDVYGTRTGRLSCSTPNLQNVPTDWSKIVTPPNLPPLPFMRRYILPDDDDHVVVSADFNGQEVRLLAHFAEGRAAEIYRNDPKADLHSVARDIIREQSGLQLERKDVKIAAFSIIYGSGPANMAEQMGCSVEEARRIKRAYLDALPGVREFQADVSSRSFVRTWGGRIIPVEPPKEVRGQTWSFEYKLANHLIQGSAADQTKESVIVYERTRSSASRFLMTVHDENVISVRKDKLHEEVGALRAAMELLPGFDVPFKVDVEYGPNWKDLQEYK